MKRMIAAGSTLTGEARYFLGMVLGGPLVASAPYTSEAKKLPAVADVAHQQCTETES
jgi:hypothetical protein